MIPGRTKARMAELVYAHDLKSCPVRDVGSMPTPGTVCEISLVVELVPRMKLLAQFKRGKLPLSGINLVAK